MIVSQIAACTIRNVIGKEGDMPWHLPVDLKYFKRVTKGRHVLMGRKTFEGIPEEFRPLPSRTNIIVTRQSDYTAGEGCVVVHSIEAGIKFAKEKGESELFIIGGGNIYKEALPLTDRVYLTRIYADIEGDTYFPLLNLQQWKLVSEDMHEADDANPWSCNFQVYERV